MADPSPGTDRVDNAGVSPDLPSTADPGTPRSVKVFGAIALVLIVVFVVLHLTGNTLGSHGVPGVSR